MWPGAVPSARVFTSMVDGLRSGRERKVLTPLGADWPPCARPWFLSAIVGEVVVFSALSGIVFRLRSDGSQPSVFASTIHAAPAPAASRNLRRVSFTLKLP